MDGGHNTDGVRALVKSLSVLQSRVILVVAMMEDKACEECAKELKKISDTIIAAQIDMPRCKKAAQLAKLLGARVIEDPIEAVNCALGIDEDAIVCVCGSLYLAGEIKSRIKEIKL